VTVQGLITQSLRLAGVQLRAGRTANADVLAESLSVLNTMLDSWNTERLIVYTITRTEWALSAAASYTLGPDGDLNGVRPVRIENAGTLDTDGNETPIAVSRDAGDWAAVRSKALTSSEPCALYDDRSFPLTTLHLWPVPTAALTLVLYTWTPLSAYGALSDTVSLPPGYLKAVQYNLAVELSLMPQFVSVPMKPLVIDIARESKASIKRVNMVHPVLTCDAAMVNMGDCTMYDIRLGDYK